MMKLRSDFHPELIKSPEEIDVMRRAGRALAGVAEKLRNAVRAGVSTLDLDQLAREAIESLGARPAFLGYHGFPATICASLNEEVVHGIPSAKRRLKDGDLISIDIGLIQDGFFSDMAFTLAVGEADAERERLLAVTEEALRVGIEAARVGARLGDLSAAIGEYVAGFGLQVVREYTGHGIGRQMHEDPRIPNFGEAGKGMRLRAGMVLAIEPMVNLGTWRTEVLDDDWTVVTADRRPSAHFEHTVALTPDGPEILTKVA